MSNEIWNWASNHYILFTLLSYIAIYFSAQIVVRTYRFIMVLVRGWPTAIYMDADGDIVHPKRDVCVK
jgi:hypothetical protein